MIQEGLLNRDCAPFSAIFFRSRIPIYRLLGFKLQALKGKEKGTWSVWVNGNWRVTFQFQGNDAMVVDYRDYHEHRG